MSKLFIGGGALAVFGMLGLIAYGSSRTITKYGSIFDGAAKALIRTPFVHLNGYIELTRHEDNHENRGLGHRERILLRCEYSSMGIGQDENDRWKMDDEGKPQRVYALDKLVLRRNDTGLQHLYYDSKSNLKFTPDKSGYHADICWEALRQATDHINDQMK
jgi:hypothetical protein